MLWLLTAALSHESLSKCLYNWSYFSVNALSRIEITLFMECFDSFRWYVEEGERRSKCREREKEKRDPWHKERRLHNSSEDRSHDLNILGDEMCPHCRDSSLSKTCSFSSVRGMHQWSIVSVLIILCCLMVGLTAVITLWKFGKSGKTIPFLLTDSIVRGYNEPLKNIHLYGRLQYQKGIF